MRWMARPCSTNKLTKDGSILHIISAIISELGFVLGGKECGTVTDEITAFRELVEMLDVSGAIVVADALHCNKKSAKAVVNAGGDYLFVVKDNLPALKNNIKMFFEDDVSSERISTTEKNGGRVERRTAFVCREIDWLEGRENWPNLACIGAIRREVEKDGKKTDEWHYYISSAQLTAESLLRHARLEWAVESMHWLLDVHFNEDKTRVWDMNVQKSLNILRKIVLNLLKHYKAQTNSRDALTDIMFKNFLDLRNLAEFLRFVFALRNVADLLQC